MTTKFIPNSTRRTLLKSATGSLLCAVFHGAAFAESSEERTFSPHPGDWQTFDVTTTVNLQNATSPSKVWIPLPSVDSEWQRSLRSDWTGNPTSVRVDSETQYGAKYLIAEFDGSTPPELEVVSRVQTRDRAIDWSQSQTTKESADKLKQWTRSTSLIPTDGIVRVTSNQIVAGARSDIEKAQRIFDWIIVSTYREPKVRG